MKRITTFLITILAFINSYAQMEFEGTLRELKGGTLGNLETMYMQQWWSDQNGNDAAIIRIKINDMSVAEMQKLDFTGSSLIGIGKKQFLEKEQEFWVAVAAGNDNQYLEVISPTFGRSTRLRIETGLKEKTFYEIVLDNKRLTTISLATDPDGVKVYLDGDYKGETPLEIANQRYGKHHIKLLHQGRSKEEDIDVEDGHTMFKFDVQKYVPVDILTEPSGSAIFVDGKMIGKSPIYDYKLILGAHTFRAEYSSTQTDEQSLNVTEQTTNVLLKPIKKSNVRIMTHYGGRPVNANLVVDNAQSFERDDQYQMVLPYGKHTFRVSYSGRSKQKTFNITKPEFVHTMKLSAKNDIVWPWQREYNHRPFGVSMGYVQKQVVASADEERYECDPAYWRDGESLSGIQIGFHFQPCFSWGGGLYTGLFYELYMASCDRYGDEVKNFSEHNLNIPAHLYYRIPFSNDFSIAVHGGVSFDCGLYACYSKNFLGISDSGNGSSYVFDNYYGSSNDGPNQFQVNWDIAASINIYNFGISAFISKGLLDNDAIHNAISGADNIAVNKFGISISYLIGGNE